MYLAVKILNENSLYLPPYKRRQWSLLCKRRNFQSSSQSMYTDRLESRLPASRKAESRLVPAKPTIIRVTLSGHSLDIVVITNNVQAVYSVSG